VSFTVLIRPRKSPSGFDLREVNLLERGSRGVLVACEMGRRLVEQKLFALYPLKVDTGNESQELSTPDGGDG